MNIDDFEQQEKELRKEENFGKRKEIRRLQVEKDRKKRKKVLKFVEIENEGEPAAYQQMRSLMNQKTTISTYGIWIL